MRPQKDLGKIRYDAKEKCPECGGDLAYEAGELACVKCGLVSE